MNYLVILNDPPYGTERSYNGLRLVISLAKQEDRGVRVFLMADAVGCAKAGQTTPNGYYNLERMIGSALRKNVQFGACGSCLDARGVGDEQLVAGVKRSSLEELTDWTLWADKVLVF